MHRFFNVNLLIATCLKLDKVRFKTSRLALPEGRFGGKMKEVIKIEIDPNLIGPTIALTITITCLLCCLVLRHLREEENGRPRRLRENGDIEAWGVWFKHELDITWAMRILSTLAAISAWVLVVYYR